MASSSVQQRNPHHMQLLPAVLEMNTHQGDYHRQYSIGGGQRSTQLSKNNHGSILPPILSRHSFMAGGRSPSKSGINGIRNGVQGGGGDSGPMLHEHTANRLSPALDLTLPSIGSSIYQINGAIGISTPHQGSVSSARSSSNKKRRLSIETSTREGSLTEGMEGKTSKRDSEGCDADNENHSSSNGNNNNNNNNNNHNNKRKTSGEEGENGHRNGNRQDSSGGSGSGAKGGEGGRDRDRGSDSSGGGNDRYNGNNNPPDKHGKGNDDDDNDDSGLGNGNESALQKKRIKTPRACDNCRRKKIRCDAINESDPPLCVHCRSHGLECTWFLPIQETRFKRSKIKDDGSPSSSSLHQLSALSPPVNLPQLNLAFPYDSRLRPIASSSSQSQSGGNYLHQSQASDPYGQRVSHHYSPGAVHQTSQYSNHSSPDYMHHGSGSSPRTPGSAGPFSGRPGGPVKEARIVGPTSIAHLMHSTSTFPTERMGEVDFKYAQSLTVDETGDGFIRIISEGDGGGNNTGPGSLSSVVQGIDRKDAEKLINYYFETHSQHFPIVSKSDFVSSETPTPLLFNCLCGISALSHHVSPSILKTIKSTIRATIKEEDVLDNSSVSNVQALLIYAFSLELEKGTAASKTWNLLGVAIRMAQDLGLHRKLGTERGLQSQADHKELRRRVWGGCLIADRWISAIYGQPMMISLDDCDCMLPSVFDIRPNSEFNGERRPYLFNSALISLSVLLGKILKSVYSPTGIMTLSAEDASALVTGLATWQNELPEELKFIGPERSSAAAGFIHLLYIAVRFLITRPFMRISFHLPARFADLSVGIEQWSKVESEARHAIEWVDRNESALEGWFVGVYAFFLAALVQYHSHIRRRDQQSLTTLRLARDIIKRLVIVDSECHLRTKIAEITHLLYNTACSVQKWAPEAAEGLAPAAAGTTAITTLNPTVGVRQRQVSLVSSLIFPSIPDINQSCPLSRNEIRNQDWHMQYKREGNKSFFVSDSASNSPRGHGPERSSGSNSSTPGVTSPYSSSLRSTHVENESKNDLDAAAGNLLPMLHQESIPDLPTSAGSMVNPFSLNFNPSLNLPTTPSGPFDPFGFSQDGTPSLYPPDGIFDWESWSSFFSAVPGGPPSAIG